MRVYVFIMFGLRWKEALRIYPFSRHEYSEDLLGRGKSSGKQRWHHIQRCSTEVLWESNRHWRVAGSWPTAAQTVTPPAETWVGRRPACCPRCESSTCRPAPRQSESQSVMIHRIHYWELFFRFNAHLPIYFKTFWNAILIWWGKNKYLNFQLCYNY